MQYSLVKFQFKTEDRCEGKQNCHHFVDCSKPVTILSIYAIVAIFQLRLSEIINKAMHQ